MAESTRSLREQLYELHQITKEMAEDYKLSDLSVDDAQFISTVTTTMRNIKSGREKS